MLGIDDEVAASVEDETAGDMDGERSGMDGTSSGNVVDPKRVEAARLTAMISICVMMQDGNKPTYLCRRGAQQASSPKPCYRVGRPNRRHTRTTIQPRSINGAPEVDITYLEPELQPQFSDLPWQTVGLSKKKTAQVISEMRSAQVEATKWFIKMECL